MKKTKLIDILSTFSRQEIKSFEKFVASPFFSRGRDLKPFYRIVKSFHPGYDNPDLNSEYIFKKLYPEEKYVKSNAENVIRVLSSELAKLAEEYLTYIVFKVHKLKNRNSLLDILISKNLNKLFTRLYTETEKELVRPILYSPQHFLDIYFFKMLDVAYNLHVNKGMISTKESEIYLMNHFFLSAGYFIYNSFIYRLEHNKDDNDTIFPHLMKFFDFKSFIPYLKSLKGIKKTERNFMEFCFYYFLCVLNRENEDYLSKFEKLFYKSKHFFTRTEKCRFYFTLIALFTERKDLNSLYKVYHNILDDDVFDHEQGKEISFSLYSRILDNFTELKKLKDAEKFVIKYSKILNTDKKDSFYNFGFALIELKRKHFEKALEYASKVEIIYFLYKFDIRNLYLKIYYELNYSEEAFSMIDSYKHFLKNNKNVTYSQRIQNNKFVNCYRKLLTIKISESKSDLLNIKKTVFNDNDLIYKDWLLEKIEEML